MHLKWFSYKNALDVIFTIKLIRNYFYEKIWNEFYYKNVFEIIIIKMNLK